MRPQWKSVDNEPVKWIRPCSKLFVRIQQHGTTTRTARQTIHLSESINNPEVLGT